MNYIDIGKKEGATVHLGGERHGTEGYFIQPTIFTDVKPEMTIVKEEIFGPGTSPFSLPQDVTCLLIDVVIAVVVVIKFRDEDDLIKMANDTLYGLSASVFSRDITKAITTANALQAGTVWINSHHIVNNNVPFGGYKRASCLLPSLPMLQNVQFSDCWFLILGL